MLLLCEGRCNPPMAEANAVIRRYGQGAGDDLRPLYRRCVYTEHQAMNSSETQFACVECGHERRFGGHGFSDATLARRFEDVRERRTA